MYICQLIQSTVPLINIHKRTDELQSVQALIHVKMCCLNMMQLLEVLKVYRDLSVLCCYCSVQHIRAVDVVEYISHVLCMVKLTVLVNK